MLKVDTVIAEQYRGQGADGELNETVLTPTGHHEVMLFSPKVGPNVVLPDPYSRLEVEAPPALHWTDPSPHAPGSSTSGSPLHPQGRKLSQVSFGGFPPGGC